MSYDLISKTEPKARKQYNCIWCVDKIQPKEVHIHEVSNYDGDFQNFRWHQECHAAALLDFKETGDCEFGAHEFKRGTTEQA